MFMLMLSDCMIFSRRLVWKNLKLIGNINYPGKINISKDLIIINLVKNDK